MFVTNMVFLTLILIRFKQIRHASQLEFFWEPDRKVIRAALVNSMFLVLMGFQSRVGRSAKKKKMKKKINVDAVLNAQQT